MLGSEEYPDTVLGNSRAGERDTKGLSVYLNSRFWDLSAVTVTVAELRSEKKNAWPQGRDDKSDRRPNNRHIRGARFYVAEIESDSSKLVATGNVMLDEDRVKAEWYLWEGERPAIHSYAKKGGYVAVRYRDELFELTASKPTYRNFGVSESKVQQQLTIILEPQLYDALSNPWGVHPDQSRNHLIFSGSGEKGVSIPLIDWGLEFADNMPAEILAAIKRIRGDVEGSIENDEYRKRLQDKFGSRWTVRKMVAALPEESEKTPGEITNVETMAPNVQQSTTRRKRKRSKNVQHVRLLANAGSGGHMIEVDAAVDVPRYKFGEADDFEEPWHLALWAPNEIGGPTVFINQDSPMLQEAIKYHQDQYPDVYADDVKNTVMCVYGEVAVAKIAHSQKLAARISEQELDMNYRNEQALTISLMGLMAEESVIATRLGKFGRKKSAA